MNASAQIWRWKYLICALLAILTAAAYAAVAGHSFIALDDRDYVVGNYPIQQGFSWDSLKWAFTTFHSNNWHPLTWLSHMLDCRLFALDPAGPHLENLAFHITNTILLFLLLFNLTGQLGAAAFVALLFGLHPMHVESVAWVAERKDLLSTFFLLLTLLAYARYVELANAKKFIRWAIYGLALLLFALGLMTKPMLVTLPGLLLLLDFWPLRRFELPVKKQSLQILLRLIGEKIPFILLAVFSCWITYFAQNSTGAVKSDAEFTAMSYGEHAIVSYAWYLFKLFWPANLSVFYPLRATDSTQDADIATLLLLFITAMVFWRARQNPYFLFGWLWFIGTMVPVVGFVQVGNQSHADRYTYIPYIGLFIMAAWGIPNLLAGRPYRKVILAMSALLVAGACFWRTTVEVGYWKNGETLFKRALAFDPRAEMCWMLLGLEYEVHGNNDKAIECENRATELNNQFYLAWSNLGHMLLIKEDYDGAINAFETAIACSHYQGNKIEYYNILGGIFTTTGQYDGAISSYQSSLDLSPAQADIQYQLAQSYAKNGQPGPAIDSYEKILQSHPDHLQTQLDLAMLLGSTGHEAEAMVHYRKVIELDTNIVIALNNLAWILATDHDPQLRNGGEAIPLAEQACQRTKYQQAFFIGTLAAAYAEGGRYEDAVATAHKAQEVAGAQGQKELAAENARLMQLYQSGKPFHEPAAPPP